jgi:single-strand DNA-binding protein
MSTINKVQLTGNLGNNPDVKTFDDGSKILRFSMATTEEYTTRKGERMKDTQWHFICVRGKLALQLENELQKGSFVSVEGRLTSRNYTDKSGQKKYITEVVALDVTINKKGE